MNEKKYGRSLVEKAFPFWYRWRVWEKIMRRRFPERFPPEREISDE